MPARLIREPAGSEASRQDRESRALSAAPNGGTVLDWGCSSAVMKAYGSPSNSQRNLKSMEGEGSLNSAFS